MRYNRKFLFGLLAVGFLLSCTQTPQQRAENATVLIVVGYTDSRVGTGSGFFVEHDKIATNIHVVASGMIFAVGKKVYNIEAVTGYDIDRDLVVLKVSGEGIPLERGAGQIGEPISVVGYPGGGYDITKGKVHGIRKSDKQLRLIAEGFPGKSEDPVIAGGNSGGPILNSEWKVIGIAASSGEGFSSAIASSALNALLDSSDKEKLLDWQKKDPIRAYVYAAWGKEKLHSENYGESIKGFDEAIELYRDYTNAYLGRGVAKAAQGDYTGAIQDYNKAIRLKKDYANAHYSRGQAKRESENYAGAIQDYNTTLELNPDDANAYNNRGVAKAAKLDYTGAIQDYTKAIELKEDDANAYLNRGNAKQNSKNYAGAVEDYNTTLELNPYNAVAYLNWGIAKAAAAQPDYTGAIQDYNKSLELNPDDADAYYNRGNAKKTLGQDGDAKLDYAKAYYYNGKANANNGHYQAAVKDFNKSIELNPESADAYLYRGFAKAAQRDYTGAIQDYEEVIKRKPDYAEAYDRLGVTHFDLNNYEVALDHFGTAIEKKPDYAEAHYNLGAALHRLGNNKQAVDHFSDAIRLKEPVIYAKAYKARGRVQKDLGNEAEAKENYAAAHYAWGDEALKRTEYPEAIEHFDAILKLDPERAHVRAARGDAKTELGKSKAALGDLEGAQNLYYETIEDYDKAIKFESMNALFYRNRGETKLLRGAVRNHNDHRIEDYEAAIEDCTEAIKVYTMEKAQKQNWENPEWNSNFANTYRLRGMARCLLGYTKANQGRSKEAQELYKKAIKEDFKKVDYPKGLGLANAALGKAKATLEAFEEAKKKEEETETGK